MLKNYIKVAFRNLNKNRVYAVINILGLALGLMVSILVFLYVKQETNYEKHFDDYQNIYRVGVKAGLMGQTIDAPVACSPMANSLRTEFPDVITATRMRPIRQEIMLSYDDAKIYIPAGIRADSAFFNVFSFEFIHGDPKTALTESNSIVLTEETAFKFFGHQNPMGKIIRYDDRNDRIVRGVIAEPKGNSHFETDFYISENHIDPLWISNNHYTYLKLRPGVDAEEFCHTMSDRFLNYLMPNVEQFLKITREEFEESDQSYE